MIQRFGALVPVLGVALAVGACGGKPPAPPPAPKSGGTDGYEATRASEDAADEARRKAADERARMRSVLEQRIHFDFDRSEIRPDARPVLDAKIEILRANPSIRLRVEGHCDERGSIEYNLALGQRRANAVRQYFIAYGIDPKRLETVSFGEERPLARSQGEHAWAQNRRAEFQVLAGLAVANLTQR